MRILREFPADAIVADPSVGAASTINEKGGPPFAVYSVTCLGLKSRDTAPFGLGLMPSYSTLGRLRNRLLYLLASDVIFRNVSKALTQQRATLGLPPSKFEGPFPSPYLYLEPTVPSFEYPRTDMPPQVHFIGAMLPEAPADFELPSWWGEVTDKKQPVVLVTQGTAATDAEQLIAPTLKALAREDVLVFAAGVKPEEVARLDGVSANARVGVFVPFKPLLPHVDVYVTNGGFGGVHHALANGVPIVCGGTTEDKPEICNRVSYSGVGINLKTNKPEPEQVQKAVKRVLSEPSYRQKARRLQAELTQHDAPSEAAALLERLADTQRPVV
jgi:UDP:flavonoid glycosyltransferase YjiC (YdhE family)